jgi:parvulin-like peptidyl-prolyl isomerase
MKSPFPSDRKVTNEQWGIYSAKIFNDIVVHGLKEHEVVQKYKDEMPPEVLVTIFRRQDLKKSVKHHLELVEKEFLEVNLPLILEAKALALTITHKRLADILSNTELLNNLSVADLRSLVSQAKELNEMIRLEQGQSTEIVEHRNLDKETILALIEEAKSDPVLNGLPDTSSS